MTFYNIFFLYIFRCDIIDSVLLLCATHKYLQLKWHQQPVCFLPESVRGAAINDLNVHELEGCMEFIHDEGHDAASTSHNFLERGKCLCHAILLYKRQQKKNSHTHIGLPNISYVFFFLHRR